MPEIFSILVFLDPKSHQVSVWKLNTQRRQSKVPDSFEPTHKTMDLTSLILLASTSHRVNLSLSQRAVQ